MRSAPGLDADLRRPGAHRRRRRPPRSCRRGSRSPPRLPERRPQSSAATRRGRLRDGDRASERAATRERGSKHEFPTPNAARPRSCCSRRRLRDSVAPAAGRRLAWLGHLPDSSVEERPGRPDDPLELVQRPRLPRSPPRCPPASAATWGPPGVVCVGALSDQARSGEPAETQRGSPQPRSRSARR